MRHIEAIAVIGSGLAGSQAALTIADGGCEVDLFEMRPVVQTPAHRTCHAAELVCSNCLRSNDVYSASGLLKQELRLLGSELLKIADASAIPGGSGLTVDREQFSSAVSRRLESHPRIRIHREEVRDVPQDGITILATGPLTSDALAASIQALTGEENLSFHDAIAPVLEAESIDRNVAFPASRYDDSRSDYLNCPLERAQYEAFRDALVSADGIFKHQFDQLNFFGCMPLEELARRGPQTLRFGPMKPVGLRDPRTGRYPYAVVQLRQENLRNDSYNMVAFQNQLKFGEQQRIFRMIPGLQSAEFIRYGQMHRNTYVCAPALLDGQLRLRSHPNIFMAGQISGVEGYVEAIATGLLAGINALRVTQGEPLFRAPRTSALGSISHYLANSDIEDFAPVRFTFDLLPALGEKLPRGQRREEQSKRALRELGKSIRVGESIDVAMV